VSGLISNDFSNVLEIPPLNFVVIFAPDFFQGNPILFTTLILWIYGVILLKSFFDYLTLNYTLNQSARTTEIVRQTLFARYARFSQKFYDEYDTASLYEMVLNAGKILKQYFNIIQQSGAGFLTLIIYISYMIYISWELSLIVILTFPLIHLSTKKLSLAIEQMAKSEWANIKNFNKGILNLFNCIPIIIGFNKHKHEEEHFMELSNEQLNVSRRAQKIQALIKPLEEIANTTALLFVALGLAYIFHSKGTLSATEALIFLIITRRALPVFKGFLDIKHNLAKSYPQLQEILSVLREHKEYIIKGGEKIFNKLNDKIELKNLSFSYNEGAPVLKNISASIPAGKITAITGENGSGKSTIFKLLLRFYDCPEDAIFLDGVDIKDIKLYSIRAHTSFTEQNSLLLNKSILENITFGVSSDVDEDKLIKLSKALNTHDFIMKLPQGYDTVITKGGQNFSGGEKQRLCILRALYKWTPLMLLDEFTSALDPKTEERVINTIKELQANRTIVFISNRLSTIKHADHIIYLDNGEVIAEGPSKKVLARKDFFSEMKNKARKKK
jgi:ABC-type multidrug transport system fused ATPase/permease subunit